MSQFEENRELRGEVAINAITNVMNFHESLLGEKVAQLISMHVEYELNGVPFGRKRHAASVARRLTSAPTIVGFMDAQLDAAQEDNGLLEGFRLPTLAEAIRQAKQDHLSDEVHTIT